MEISKTYSKYRKNDIEVLYNILMKYEFMHSLAHNTKIIYSFL